jgi:hypothetical protein
MDSFWVTATHLYAIIDDGDGLNLKAYLKINSVRLKEKHLKLYLAGIRKRSIPVEKVRSSLISIFIIMKTQFFKNVIPFAVLLAFGNFRAHLYFYARKRI